MYPKADMKQHSRQALRKVIPSLAVNWLVPLILYSLLRDSVPTDAAALAIAGAVPGVWVVFQMLIARRIDWIGLLGLAGFGAACLISVLSGGGSMPLKLYHPAAACAIGIAALGSVALNKPLALLFFRSFGKGDSARFDIPAVRRKMTQATAVFGSLFLLDGIVHAMMAYSLSTGAFLVWSRVVTLGALAILVLWIRHILWHKKSSEGGNRK
ncbi:VC0807 family protein [Cohnella zeiphila]|uniref:Intracellular septation protein A n=1 Tax=Cohnella zeiphila TaxID=2761120 RepID=A0A7X0VUZ2_9BACL|nr:VC0807 family protein [Cohnella zeiphila]MBB6730822.1 hypothetical protein [Cohnella zeiphila]